MVDINLIRQRVDDGYELDSSIFCLAEDLHVGRFHGSLRGSSFRHVLRHSLFQPIVVDREREQASH